MPPPLREGCAPRALTGGGARGEGEALRLKRVGAGVAAERPPRARALAPVGEEVEGESTAGQEAGEWRSRTSLKTCRNGVGIRIPPPPHGEGRRDGGPPWALPHVFYRRGRRTAGRAIPPTKKTRREGGAADNAANLGIGEDNTTSGFGRRCGWSPHAGSGWRPQPVLVGVD